MSTFWIEFFNWQSNSRTVDLFSSHCTLILITTIYNRITLFTLRSTNPPITYVLVGSIVSSAVWPSGDKYTSEEGSNTDSLNKSHFHQSLTKVPYEKLQANSLHQHIEEIHYMRAYLVSYFLPDIIQNKIYCSYPLNHKHAMSWNIVRWNNPGLFCSIGLNERIYTIIKVKNQSHSGRT